MVSMQELQQDLHGQGHDYATGSPHIKHFTLRSMIIDQLQHNIRTIYDRKGSCSVLEIGAGHGTFTDHIVAAGADVEVTEMSVPSAEHLQERFSHNKSVVVTLDPDGSRAASGDPVDIAAFLSVIHHIPDYLGAISSVIQRIAPGGSFISFQDPLWYPRRSWLERRIDRAVVLAWRIPQGNLRRGVNTFSRRVRGVWDDTNPSDMVEYHVMRDGVDEQALYRLLSENFSSVQIVRYWSTQAGWGQFVGAKLFRPNTFGIIATGRI